TLEATTMKVSNFTTTTSSTAVAEPAAPAQSSATSHPQESSKSDSVPQDPKDKLSGLKLEGTLRETQMRNQLDSTPVFKMPGVDVKGPKLDDAKVTDGFKAFDKPMPSVDLNWPAEAKGKWSESKTEDGKTTREM